MICLKAVIDFSFEFDKFMIIEHVVSGTVILRNFGVRYISNEEEVQESAHFTKLYKNFENFFHQENFVKVLSSFFKLFFVNIV